MTLYRYSARAADGSARSGELEAASASAAAARLTASGMVPVHIDTAKAAALPTLSLPGRGPVRADELAVFCRQMHTLLRAGVALNRALASLADGARSRTLASALREVGDSLSSGKDLATALAQHPAVFSRLIVSMVHMGEDTGRLEEVFLELARHIERDHETGRKVRSALRYPTMVIAAVAGAVTLINVFVVPAFADMFRGQGLELPLATRVLIATSDLFVYGWGWLLGGIAASFLGARAWLATDAGRLRWDAWRLRLPAVGSIALRGTLARFARSLAMSLRSGVPVLGALQTVGQALVNRWIEERVDRMCERIRRGESLTAGARAAGIFPPLMLQIISVGEESGAVEEMLDEVADYYERDVDYDLKRLSETIEPVLIVVLGAIVLVLALGVYLPLWEMTAIARSG